MEEDQSIRQAKKVLRRGKAFSSSSTEWKCARAVDLIYRCKGRVIVAGIGKSGLIGRKIAATLTSTGTQALFLHPVEGLHGDLGIVTKDDILLAISHSGETGELNMIIESIRTLGVPRIAFTGDLSSTLAHACDVVIDVGVNREACPFGLAPTSSSTAALAMGDALAVALIQKRNFQEKDFFKFHPAGSLGSRLRAKVRDVMIGGALIPHVLADDRSEAIRKWMKRTRVSSKSPTIRNLLGILTDGDVRRLVRRERLRNQQIYFLAPFTQDPRKYLRRPGHRTDAARGDHHLVVTTQPPEGIHHLHDILAGRHS